MAKPDKPDKRHEVMCAALDLFAEQGFHGAPMSLIAERTGVGAGTIYRYFENRDILISELFKEVEENIIPFILDGYSEQDPFRVRFIHLGSQLLRYFIQHPLHFRYLEQFHNSPYGVAHRRDKILGKVGKCNVFKELFEQGASQQVLKDLPLPMLIALAFGPLLGVARDHILGFVRLDEKLIIKAIEACWDTVKR
ncbi:MAG: TetR/AcrR family transcriptional regulator [Geobacteraceae bacterium]|nr:TetR/AcrR family transcriptional regulator [Geobacteraceae bacterium]